MTDKTLQTTETNTGQNTAKNAWTSDLKHEMNNSIIIA